MELRPGETLSEPLQRKKEEFSSSVQWVESVKPRPWENLTKNLAVASALLVSVVALRNGAVPSAADLTEVVVAAASHDTLLDDQLGRLTFVSKIFPEATLVFGEATADAQITAPVEDGAIVHAWSEQEPFLLLQSTSADVYSPVDGVVMGVYHGDGEELIVHVQRGDGVSVYCGNLAACTVAVGDEVMAGDPIGQMKDGAACSVEMRDDGWNIDPTALLRP